MRFIRYVLLVILSAGLLFVIYLENGINFAIDEEGKENLNQLIEDSPNLTDNYFLTIERHVPGVITNSVWKSIFSKVMGKQIQCPCLGLNTPYISGLKKAPFHTYIIALYLEDQYGKKRCHEFYMNFAEFGDNVDGIFNAADYFFSATIDSLNEEQIIGLHLMSQAPYFYNPRINSENYNEGIKAILY